MGVLQKKIEILEPKIRIASEKIAKQVSDVQTALESIEEQREAVKRDEIVSNDKIAIAADLAEQYKTVMEEVTTNVHEADNLIAALTPIDLNAVRTMKNAPVAVKIVMEGVCILRETKMSDESWSASKKLLNDPRFTEYLLNFDKDAIPELVSKKMQEKIMTNESFDVEKLKSLSPACEALCRWIIAIMEYDRIVRFVQPKRQELREAENSRDSAVTAFSIRNDELLVAEKKLSEMQKQLASDKDEAERLKSEHEQSTKCLLRATEIVNCLGGEGDRWQCAVKRLQKVRCTLFADVLIGTAMVAYLGSFPMDYRTQQADIWREKCAHRGFICNE